MLPGTVCLSVRLSEEIEHLVLLKKSHLYQIVDMNVQHVMTVLYMYVLIFDCVVPVVATRGPRSTMREMKPVPTVYKKKIHL